jgi:hypothetical protein
VSIGRWDIQTYCDSRPAKTRAQDIDENRYQATTGEEIEDSVCFSENKSARISESVIITCSYNVYVFNKSN